MKQLKSEHLFCQSCMEEHEVQLVEVQEKEVYKGVEVSFPSHYFYCPETEEMTETEELLQSNTLAIKDAYRRVVGLLTSQEIREIRERFGISQKDFAEILEWGRATITRYETHQVQDRAHDDILLKLSEDPEWFLQLLEKAKERLSPKAYNKYRLAIQEVFSHAQDLYIIKAIRTQYVSIDIAEYCGNQGLDFIKIVQAINYFAAQCDNLYKVKLMKLLWYADMLCYKRIGRSLTGQAYSAFPMGALPLCHDQIICLDGVVYTEVDFGEGTGLKFSANSNTDFSALSLDEQAVLNTVVEKLGFMKTEAIIDYMHEEDAYKNTSERQLISYRYAKNLSLE